MSKSTAVVIAPTRDKGREFVRNVSHAFEEFKGAHILTPRSTGALRGVTGIDQVVVTEAMPLTPDMVTALALSVKSR